MAPTAGGEIGNAVCGRRLPFGARPCVLQPLAVAIVLYSQASESSGGGKCLGPHRLPAWLRCGCISLVTSDRFVATRIDPIG
jgi:hypothetical protein